MQIDHSLILRLEKLANLELSEEERLGLLGDMNKILVMIEKLDELNTADVEPLVYVSDHVNATREDLVRGQVTRDQALANAPGHNSEYFKVPKVL